MKRTLTILLAALFLLACYVPVSAADWDLYGSARMATFWTDASEELGDDTQLDHSLQGNSRIGAHVDAGAIGGRFEYGTGVNTRLLYGTFDVGPGQLLVGQHYTPYGLGSFISTQVYGGDAGMLQFMGYNGRVPMVQYSYNNFDFALVQPQTPGFFDIAPGDETDGNPEVLLPQIAARYSESFNGVSLDIAGVFQTYELQELNDETLTAWGLTANATLNMMDPFYVSFGGFFGQNVAHFGQWSIVDSTASVDLANNSIEDTDTYGLLLVLGTQFNGIAVQGGAGYVASENSDWTEDDETIAYYLQAKIPMTDAGNAFIMPEIGYYDYRDDNTGADAGDDFYVGLQWRVDF